jgi:hypothetical protein
MNATTIETNSSRIIMLSQPDLVIEVIRKAVATVQNVGRSMLPFPARTRCRLQAGLSFMLES